jgi:hypothetical protein
MRVVAPIYAFACFFVLAGVAAIVIGVHDASLDQAGFGVTAGGALLIGIGVIVCVAAYQLLRLGRPGSREGGARPPGRVVVLVAFSLTLLLGIYVFFAALETASGQWPFVLAAALVLVVVSLLGFGFFASRAHVTLPRIGAAIALGIIGTAIGAWEFWYQNQYVPSHAGQAVALKVELHRDGNQGAYDVIRATVGYGNVGGKSVAVIGSMYTLTGSRVVRCVQPATAKRLAGFFDYPLVDPQRIRYMLDVWEERPATVLAAGKFVGDGKRLDPDVSSGRDLTFFVPRHRYQLLRLRAQLFAVPGSVRISRRTPAQYSVYPDDREVYELWHLDDDSWFHDLAYGRERWVVLRYEIVDPKRRRHEAPVSPDMRVTARFPDATWGKGQPSEATVQRLFSGQSPPGDASEPFGDTELAIEPVAEPVSTDKRFLKTGCSGT